MSAATHLMNTYGRLPFALSHGKGCRVWDTEGREYLDALAGIAVNTLGHGHPKLVPALQDQVSKLIHCSNYYQVPLQEQLAAALCEVSGLSAAFFCNTGLEANEGAIKIARKFGHDRGIDATRDHRLREGLPRPLDRHALGHRQHQGAEGLRAAGRRLRAGAAERHRRGARRGAQQPQRGGRVPRGDPGRRRHQPQRARNTCASCARCATSATGC